jgi:hypothetical protein
MSPAMRPASPKFIRSDSQLLPSQGVGDVAELNLKTMLIMSYLDTTALLIKSGIQGYDDSAISASIIGTISLINLIYPQLDKASDVAVKDSLGDIRIKLYKKVDDNYVALNREERVKTIILCLKAQELVAIKFKIFGLKIERKISAEL